MLKLVCGIQRVTRFSINKPTLSNTFRSWRTLSIISCVHTNRGGKDNSVMSETTGSIPASGSGCKNDGSNNGSNEKASGNSSNRRRKRNSKKKHVSESDANAGDNKNHGNETTDSHDRNGYVKQNRKVTYSSPQKTNTKVSPEYMHHDKSPHKSNQQRNKLPEINFQNYISSEECTEGIKRGELIVGTLRINPKSYQDGYIDSETGGRDIYIEGIEMRNRALPGDIIAVKLLPKDQWKKTSSNDDTENDDDLYFAKTGKVVYIIQKKHSRVAAGHLNPFRNHSFGFALMSPVDNRIPRLMIPLNECPPNFKARPKDSEKILFVARIISWGLNMPFASGKLMRSLGEAGHIEPETEAIIMSNNIDSSEFQEDVVSCLPDGSTWKITKEELEKRKDLRKECIFTIDPATARDLDDALSCKKIDEDLYEVGVHIADVSYFIEQGNALDEVAKERATSVYLAQRVIPMLPRVLCEQLCSLNPGVDRLAYSVIWHIKSDGTIVREWFGRTVICSCIKLSYDHAQQMIDSTTTDEVVEEQYPPLHGGFTLEKISGIVKDLYGISAHLRKLRFDSGALRIDMPKLAFSLDAESGLPNGCRVYEYKNSNEMIEEFMLLANMAVGRKIYQSHPKKAILRKHPPPHDMMMSDLQRVCEDFGIQFDISDSASINSSLKKIIESHPEAHEYLYPALTLMCAKPFQNAEYFCTGTIDNVDLFRHYALNVPIYTHFTSPIRRYPDVLVHRLLTASLVSDFNINADVKELQITADHCNDKKWAAKKASEQSSLLFFAVYVKECGPLTEKGVVVGILDKSIDVLSIRLGTVNRVYCDQLSLSKHDYRLDEVNSHMTLYWQDNSDTKKGTLDERLAALTKQFEQRWQNKREPDESSTNIPEEKDAGNTESTIKQELTIFSPVDLILSVKPNAPTKILASILNPYDINENPDHGL